MHTMLIRVDPDSPIGLAEQIAGQIRGALVAEEVAAGDRLPPARELAAGLDVNMHTVLRAYSALRDEGLIDLRRGRGAQVRTGINLGLTELDQQIQQLLDTGQRLGMDRAQLASRISGAAS